MKYRIILIIFTCFFSCNSNKKMVKKESLINQTKYCPEDGVCTFTPLFNKTLDIKKDKFGNTYPKIVDGTKTVLKFTYTKKTIENTADSNYQEIIYAEINANQKSIVLNDLDLSKVKLLYGRLCFCRGQTGYYTVKKGNLSIVNNKDKSSTFNLDFTITEVPQIINSISENYFIK